MAAVSSKVLRPDLCIVGAGRAGLAVATGAAALGVPTVVIDRSDLSSALPRAGDIARLVLRRNAANPGAVEWQALKAASVAAAESRAPAMSATHLRALGLHVIHGAARFTGPGTIETAGSVIEARRIVLATGCVPAIPSLPGLDDVPWSSADRWLDLPSLPDRLVILGAGRTGIEMAQWFRRLGSEVTIVDGAAPLRGFDPELTAPVLATLRREGIQILAGQTVLRAEPEGAGLRLVLRDPNGTEHGLQGSHLMIAIGRLPAVDGLGLDRAGIRCDTGGIVVGPTGQTGNAKIFAIGDVTGRGRSVEAAEAQAGLALRAMLFRQRVPFDPRRVPRLLRTDPEIAVIGLTEPEARARHGAIGVWRWPLAETDHGRATGSTGHIKVLTTASKRIVGVGIVGPGATDAIGLWTLALAQGLTLGDIAAVPLPASTSADLSHRVALQGAISGLNGPWLQKALKVVRWLG